MIDGALTFAAIWLALLGISSLIAFGPHQLPARLLFFWFLWSWLGQSFAGPFAFLSALVAFTGYGHPLRLTAAIVAVLCFALMHRRNRAAGRVLLRACGVSARIPASAGFAPLALGDSRVRRIADIAYGPGGERQLLDVVTGHDAEAGDPRPVLLHVHGGAWVLGHKNQQARPLINHMARKGWVCVDINYRLGPKDRMPAMIEDVLAATRWVQENIAGYGGDPSRIAITGGSAGGHLTALAALAFDDPALGGVPGACPYVAAVPLYGRFDFLDRARRSGKNHRGLIEDFAAVKFMPGLPQDHAELWTAVSPLDRVRADAPPTLAIHGTADTLLPAAESEEFVEKLNEVSDAGHRYVELPAIQHAYDIMASPLTWAHVRAVEAFLDERLALADAPHKGV